MRNSLFIYGGIILLGTIATFLWGKILFWISFVVWIIYFLKDFHIDHEKAYGKYRK